MKPGIINTEHIHSTGRNRLTLGTSKRDFEKKVIWGCLGVKCIAYSIIIAHLVALPRESVCSGEPFVLFGYRGINLRETEQH